MKKLCGYILGFSLLVVSACSMSPLSGSSGINPIFPRTNSILPLEKGIRWIFSCTAYDSLGKKIFPERLDFHIAINEQYGLRNDTELVRLDANNYSEKFGDYAYQYEMEQQAKGVIVVYRSLYPLGERGVYLIGEYNGTTITKYPKEQLWLAYPADSGKVWQFKDEPLGDTTKIVTMELLSTNARSYVIDRNSPTGVSFVDSCYLYRQTSGTTVSYYYYNEKIGLTGLRRYTDGVLRYSIVLKEFSRSGYYYD